MIRERPVVESFDVAYQDSAGVWQNLASKATRATAQRGGKRTGVANQIAVGTMSVDLYGAMDLEIAAQLRPNTPIRIAGRNARPGAIALAEPVPPTDAFFKTASAGAGSVATRLQNRPALDGVPAGNRWSWVGRSIGTAGPTTINTGFSSGYSGGARQMKEIPAASLQTGRRYRVSMRMNDWSAEEAVPMQFQVLWSPVSTFTDYQVIDVGEPRRVDATRYTDLPSVEFLAAETTGIYTVVVLGTKRITFPAGPARNVGAYSVTGFRVEMLPTEPDAVFTGTIVDLQQREELDKNTGRSQIFTTLLATDNVQPLANTKRYGAIAEGGFENWEDRIRRLAASSPVPTDLPRGTTSRVVYTRSGVDGWTALSGSIVPEQFKDSAVDVPPTVWPRRSALYVLYRRTAALTAAIGTLGVQRVLRGLTPGATYRVSVNATIWENTTAAAPSLRIGVAGVGVGPATALPLTPNGVALVTYQFTATGTTHTVQITNGAAVAFQPNQFLSMQIQPVTIVETGRVDPFRLQSTVYEGSLASHFDLACNSTGAYWWVDSHGIAQFRAYSAPDEIVGSWTDNPAELNDPLTFAYTDIDTSFDTKGLVTALTLQQHGAKPGDKGWDADDSATTFDDATGIDRWGVRGDQLDTTIHTGPGFESALAERANDVFAERARTARTITGFQWNAQENPGKALALEIYDRVRVKRGKLVVTARIIGLKHTITPTRWIVDVALTEISTGIPFEQLNTALGTRTFAQWNAIIGSASFAELNADILKGLN